MKLIYEPKGRACKLIIKINAHEEDATPNTTFAFPEHWLTSDEIIKIAKEIIIYFHSSEENVEVCTNSIYLVSQFNNCILAHEIGKTFPQKTDKIMPKRYWLNPMDIVVIEAKTGKRKKLTEQNEIDTNLMDRASEKLYREFSKLLKV